MMHVAAFLENIMEGAKAKEISLKEALQKMQEAGLDKIYVGKKSIDQMGESLFELFEELNLPVEGLHGWFDFGHHPEDESYKQFIDCAVKCGASNVLFVPGLINRDEADQYEQQKQNMKTALIKAVAYGEEKGIAVSMENLDGVLAPYCSVEGLNWFMQEVKGLQCSFDTGNFVIYHEDELKALEVFRDKICTLHVKDRSRTRLHEKDGVCTCADGVEVYPSPVGYGFMQIKEILNRLKETGYEGGVIAEMYGCQRDYALEGMIKSVQWLKANV